jgi:hypothetical protein
MKLFVIICSILLLYIVVFFYIHWVNKRNKEGAVTTSKLLYGDARDSGYYPPDVPSWHNKTKNFEYWNSDKGIQNWISSSPQLIYTKSYAGNANGEDWFFPSDGLYYVTYNACYGLIHVAKDFGSNQRMTIISTQNRGYGGTSGLRFYDNGGGAHLHVEPVNNQSGVLMVFKLFDAYSGSSPANN